MSRDKLSELTVKLVRLSSEKALKDTLKSVASELPEEVLDEVYKTMYRPVMVLIARRLYSAMFKKS